jgi:hypothetical protein
MVVTMKLNTGHGAAPLTATAFIVSRLTTDNFHGAGVFNTGGDSSASSASSGRKYTLSRQISRLEPGGFGFSETANNRRLELQTR